MARKNGGTLDIYVERYLTGRRNRGEIARRTAKEQRYVLRNFAEFFGERPVTQLGRCHVEAWLEVSADRRRRAAPSSQRHRLSVISGFCAWLANEKAIRTDPTVGIARIRVPRREPVTCDPEEVSRLLSACPSLRERLVTLLMVQCGLRCVSVVRLDLADVGRNSLRVDGKGHNEHTIYLPIEVREALDDYLVERGGQAGPLIQSKRDAGCSINEHSLSMLMSKIFREAGVKRHAWDGRGAHALRRTAATDMLDHGTIEEVAEVLGHADLATVQRYAKAKPQRLRDVMEGRRYGGARVISMKEVG